MAIKIVSGGNYVSKVVIGTPIKRVKGALNMSNLADVDLTGSQKFIVSTSLGGQTLNGGNF